MKSRIKRENTKRQETGVSAQIRRSGYYGATWPCVQKTLASRVQYNRFHTTALCFSIARLLVAELAEWRKPAGGAADRRARILEQTKYGANR